MSANICGVRFQTESFRFECMLNVCLTDLYYKNLLKIQLGTTTQGIAVLS